MQLSHGVLEITGQHPRQDIHRPSHRVFHHLPHLGGRAAKHVAGDGILVARVADTDPQSQKATIRHMTENIPQAVVTAMTTTLLQANDARRKVEIIVHIT